MGWPSGIWDTASDHYVLDDVLPVLQSANILREFMYAFWIL